MQRLLWFAVEWQLNRALAPSQVAPTLGDLTEDYDRQVRERGRLRADAWLLRESLSVARAYRARELQERRGSRRLVAGRAWLDDARFALRRIRKRPAASSVSIVTLACAIGAGAVTWSLLSALLLAPLPVADPDRLVSVDFEYPRYQNIPSSRSPSHVYPVYLAIRNSRLFEGLAAGGINELLVQETGGAVARPRPVHFASFDYFSTLGVRMQLGRTFTASDDRRGAPLIAVISDRYWRSAWDADPGIVGRTLTLLGQHATIAGVSPRGFRGLNLAEAPDIYLPLHAIEYVGAALGRPGFNPFAEPASRVPPRDSPTAWIRITGRMKPGWTTTQAQAFLENLRPDGRRTFLVTPVNDAAIPAAARERMTQFTSLLTWTVALLVLIGCLTVGMLLLVRTESRRDEFAVCLALGGNRVSLARGVAIEGALLTAGGVALALPAASWLFSGLGAFELPGRIEIGQLDLALGRSTWTAMAVCAGLAIVLMTLVATVFGFSPNVADVIRSRSGATPRTARRRTRAMLVSVQVAVSLVLLAGAGLFARSLMSALSVNTGFDARRIVIGSVALARHGYTASTAGSFFDELRRQLDAQPAIEGVSLITGLGSMGTGGSIWIDGVKRNFPSEVIYTAVDERYFSLMGMRTIEGRAFSPSDTMNASLVVIVSESFGRLLAAGASPVGHRITDTSSRIGKDALVRDVVGVVPDVITNVNDTRPLIVYYPVAQQDPSQRRTLVMKTRTDEAAVIRAAMGALAKLDSRVQPEQMMTMEQRLGRQMEPQRLGGFILGSLGAIAFLLTMLGAYVLAESMSSGRKRELGIRAALGASHMRLGGLVLSQTARLVGAGLLAGFGLAWMGASTIRGFLFRIEPLDPATLGGASAAILLITLLVSLRPAVEAARVDLSLTLRDE